MRRVNVTMDNIFLFSLRALFRRSGLYAARDIAILSVNLFLNLKII